MRRGEIIPGDHSISTGFFPRYYEELLPHYKEFADALVEYQHTINYYEEEITTFGFLLGNMPLPRHLLDILQDALEQTHFQRMLFHGNRIDGFDFGRINFITNCVSADTRLKFLFLTDVTFEDSKDIDLLCSAISRNESLRHIALSSCRGEGGILREIFVKHRSTSVQAVTLEQNHFSNLRSTDISGFLSSNPSLKLLTFFDSNFCNGQYIGYISNALRLNNTLRQLKFGNSVASDNFHHIERTIFDDSSLNAAYDSNHHCQLDYDRNVTSYIERFNVSHDPALNRRKKIYNILSTRNRSRENAAYFDSDGLGINHVPQILALLKPFSEHHLNGENYTQEDVEVKPLSIAYEIMRDWKMPELYSLDLMEED